MIRLAPPRVKLGRGALPGATGHDAFDYEAIAKHARLLVDTRGRYAKAAGNIVKA